MMTGSDFGGGWVVPGVSLHQEFDLLEKAGLTPLRILQMTTWNGAEFLKRESTMGTVEEGKDANLVLLDANPLESVQSLHTIHAVVRAGSLYSRQCLEGLKEQVAGHIIADEPDLHDAVDQVHSLNLHPPSYPYARPAFSTENNMRIICVEEHTGDQDLLKAGQPKQKAEASYFTEVGTDFKGSLDDGDDKLPSTLNFQTSAKLLPDRDGGRLAIMDQHGIDMQILSYSNPSQYVPADQQVELTRQANDRLAESVRANPTRFGGFACLPWGHPKAAAEELERTVKELGFVGTLLIGRPGDTFLDDPRYDPILAKLNELRVPIYLHPGVPLPQVQQPYYGGLATQVTARLSLFGWGWHNEAGVHLLRLLLSRKFDEYSNLQVISGHWGEMVPFYLSRLTMQFHRLLPVSPAPLQKPSRNMFTSHPAALWVSLSSNLFTRYLERIAFFTRWITRI